MPRCGLVVEWLNLLDQRILVLVQCFVARHNKTTPYLVCSPRILRFNVAQTPRITSPSIINVFGFNLHHFTRRYGSETSNFIICHLRLSTYQQRKIAIIFLCDAEKDKSNPANCSRPSPTCQTQATHRRNRQQQYKRPSISIISPYSPGSCA